MYTRACPRPAGHRAICPHRASWPRSGAASRYTGCEQQPPCRDRDSAPTRSCCLASLLGRRAVGRTRPPDLQIRGQRGHPPYGGGRKEPRQGGPPLPPELLAAKEDAHVTELPPPAKSS